MIPGLFLAGAEGLEPSARGFGVDVGKALRRKTSRSFQQFAGSMGLLSRKMVLF